MISAATLFAGCAIGPKLSPVNLDQVNPGMTDSEVVAVAGNPTSKTPLPAPGYVYWEWKRIPYPYDNGQTFAVVIHDGRVFEVGKPRIATTLDEQIAQGTSLGLSIRKTREEEAKAAVQSRRQNYVDTNPSLTERTRTMILDGKIGVGMSPSDVVASWGEPERKNVSDGKYGRHDQWVYHSKQYLYFDEEKLTSWQFSE